MALSRWEKFKLSVLEPYVNLFSNRFNEGCDVCWFIYGQLVAFLAGGVAVYAIIEIIS